MPLIHLPSRTLPIRICASRVVFRLMTIFIPWFFWNGHRQFSPKMEHPSGGLAVGGRTAKARRTLLRNAELLDLLPPPEETVPFAELLSQCMGSNKHTLNFTDQSFRQSCFLMGFGERLNHWRICRAISLSDLHPSTLRQFLSPPPQNHPRSERGRIRLQPSLSA